MIVYIYSKLHIMQTEIITRWADTNKSFDLGHNDAHEIYSSLQDMLNSYVSTNRNVKILGMFNSNIYGDFLRLHGTSSRNVQYFWDIFYFLVDDANRPENMVDGLEMYYILRQFDATTPATRIIAVSSGILSEVKQLVAHMFPRPDQDNILASHALARLECIVAKLLA